MNNWVIKVVRIKIAGIGEMGCSCHNNNLFTYCYYGD
jgi:hypothetical protein